MRRVIRTNDTLVTPNAVLPVSVDFVKLHIKALSTAEDDLVTSWVWVADQRFREMTGRPTLNEQRQHWLEAFPASGPIELPYPPLVSVQAVEYLNDVGDWVSFDDGGSPETVRWQVRATSGPHARRGFVEPKPGYSWPVASTLQAMPVRVSYTAGYGETADDTPELVKWLLCMLVGSSDQFRSSVHHTERGGKLEVVPGFDVTVDGFKYSALPSMVPRSLA